MLLPYHVEPRLLFGFFWLDRICLLLLMEFVAVVATFHLHLVQQLHNFWTVVKCRTKIVGVGVEPLSHEPLTEPFSIF